MLKRRGRLLSAMLLRGALLWMARRRRWRPSWRELEQRRFRTQTRGMSLRMTEFARDRLRPAWLRLRRDAGQPPRTD